MPRHLLTCAAAICLAAGAAAAAPLNLPLQDDPEITAVGSSFNDFGGLGFFFEAVNGGSTPPAPGAGLDVVLAADIAGDGSLGALGGALNVGGGSGPLFLGGVVERIGFTIDPDPQGEDELEFLLVNLSGSAADAFGSRAVASVRGMFGDSEDDIFEGFDATDSSIGVQAVIPVPATLPLALGAFALLSAVGVRRLRG